MKRQMIRVAAHDLRSPLGVVSGYVAILQEELSQEIERFRPYLEPIERAVQRMNRMTTDVLSLERIHAAQGNAWQSFSLRELVERSVLDNREQASQKKLQVSADLTPDSAMLLGDPVQVYEAVVNLVNNAIKYTPPGGQVTVKLSINGGLAVREVKDTGIGVPDESKAKLFQPFYRVKTQETRLIDGTGLGLYLVKGIIERHGGVMRFESEHGKGSTFGFEMPLYMD